MPEINATIVRRDINVSVSGARGPQGPAGADGAQGPAGADAARRKERRLSVVLAGDSITRGGSSGPGEATIRLTGTFAEMGVMLSAQPYRILSNAGVGGNTSAMLRARFAADVLSYAPDIVILTIGTNNVLAAPTMPDAAIVSLMDDIEAMVVDALAIDALPVIVVPPANNTGPAGIRKLVPYYYRLAEAYDLPLVDTYAVTVDPATGNWKAGYAGDGTHPNSTTGIPPMAAALAAVLDDLSLGRARNYMAACAETAVGQPANLLANGCFALGAGGSAVTNWTLDGNVAVTPTTPDATAPYTGRTMTFVKTDEGSRYLATSAAVSTGFSVGDRLRFSTRFKLSGLSASPSGIYVQLTFNGPGLHLRPAFNWTLEGDFRNVSGEAVVPAGTTSIQAYLYAQDAGTYEMSNWTVTNLTAQDAIWAPSP